MPIDNGSHNTKFLRRIAAEPKPSRKFLSQPEAVECVLDVANGKIKACAVWTAGFQVASDLRAANALGRQK